jgi:hypothetical protein
MSQYTLTPEEDQLVLDALQGSAARYAAMFGAIDPVLQTLIAKIEGQLPQPVVEEPVPVATEVVEPEMVVETPQEIPTEALAE